MSINLFLQHLSNGISLGSLYAMIAVGYTIVYGVLKLINFAHGDIFMMAAYFAMLGLSAWALPWPIACLASIILTIILGVLIEKIAYKPLRNAPRLSVFISAVAMSFLIQNLAIVIFGGRPKAFNRPELFSKVYQINNINIQSITIYIVVVTILSLLLLSFVVKKTKIGRAMRAVSESFDTASLMGIQINKVISFTFVLGSGLAAIGAILWSMKFPEVQPLMGSMPGLKAFIAAVLGGIGSIEGAVVGGFLLGLVEILLVAFFPYLTGYRDLIAFLILIVVLLLRPGGIFNMRIMDQKV